MVKKEKYKKPPALAVPVLKDRDEQSYHTKFAAQLEEAKKVRMEDMRAKLSSMMEDGSFKAFLSSSRKPRGLKADVQQRLSVQEQAALHGAVFREEGVEWKVLKAQWKSSLGCIVVFYYDVAAAAASGVDEDDLHDDHEFVEHSSVDEVMEWC